VQATDDLHRADEASLLLWQRLCRMTGSSLLLLLVVATCQPGSYRSEFERLRRIVGSRRGLMPTLPELGTVSLLALARSVLGAAASQGTSRLGRTRGVEMDG
jgi:hypothetical protein